MKTPMPNIKESLAELYTKLHKKRRSAPLYGIRIVYKNIRDIDAKSSGELFLAGNAQAETN